MFVILLFVCTLHHSPRTVPLVGFTLCFHLVRTLGGEVREAIGPALATHEVNPHDSVLLIVEQHHNLLNRCLGIGGFLHLKVVYAVALDGRNKGVVSGLLAQEVTTIGTQVEVGVVGTDAHHLHLRSRSGSGGDAIKPIGLQEGKAGCCALLVAALGLHPEVLINRLSLTVERHRIHK